MTTIVAVANQKGGVAKTTTVASLGAAVSEQGRRVLLVDLDAQACLTFSLGLDADDVVDGVAAVLAGTRSVAECVVSTEAGPDLLPATLELAAAEAALFTAENRETVLRHALAQTGDTYDLVVIDCSPTLGLLTLNALAAADEVIIPMQCEMLSHRGVGQLLDTVDDVRRLVNPGLVVRGVLPTMYDRRLSHATAVLEDVSSRYGLRVLEPPIPRSARFAESPGLGRSVLQTAGRSAGAVAYRKVAASLMKDWKLRPRRARKAS